MKKLSLGLIVFMVTFNSSAQFDPEAELILESMSKKYKSKSAFMSTFQQNLINEIFISSYPDATAGTHWGKTTGSPFTLNETCIYFCKRHVVHDTATFGNMMQP